MDREDRGLRDVSGGYVTLQGVVSDLERHSNYATLTLSDSCLPQRSVRVLFRAHELDLYDKLVSDSSVRVQGQYFPPPSDEYAGLVLPTSMARIE